MALKNIYSARNCTENNLECVQFQGRKGGREEGRIEERKVGWKNGSK